MAGAYKGRTNKQTEASEFDPNHFEAQPQLRVKDAYELSPNSDKPDPEKNQIVYLMNEPYGMVFVDEDKCKKQPGRFTMHEKAFMAKNGGQLPTADDYPIAGGGHRKGLVATNSTTFNSSSRKPNGTAWSRSETSKRFPREIQKHLDNH